MCIRDSVETLRHIELTIDANLIAAYQHELALYRAALDEQIACHGGQMVRLDDALSDEELMRSLITSGLLA